VKTRTAVDAYLRELDEELRDLPAARRRELLEEIREHIDSALAESRTSEDVEVRNVLDRLGDPTEIAAEARERFGIRRTKPGVREILVLILLPFGGFLWLVGWVVGAILLATSNAWTDREKVIGLLVVPGGLLPAAVIGLMGGSSCIEAIENGRVVSETCSGGMPMWLAYVILAVLVIGPIWTVFFLIGRMNRRAATGELA
jgi:metal-sulfur cluster biosynthetic enzyme